MRPSLCFLLVRLTDSRAYRSTYQDLPLHSLDELRELAAREEPPAGLQVPLPAGDTQESAHELMLARLAFELAERKRCAALSSKL